MNRKLFLLFLVLVILIKCKSSKSIIVTPTVANLPIMVKYDKKYNKYYKIKIPIKLKIHNKSYSRFSFGTILYEYGKSNSSYESIFQNIEGKLVPLKNNNKKSLRPSTTREYIIYTSHQLDSNRIFQNRFKDMLGVLNIKKEEKFSIGSFINLPLTAKEYLKNLLNEDKILINVWDDNDIIVPIK